MSENYNREIKLIEAELNENGVVKLSVDTFTQPVFILPRKA